MGGPKIGIADASKRIFEACGDGVRKITASRSRLRLADRVGFWGPPLRPLGFGGQARFLRERDVYSRPPGGEGRELAGVEGWVVHRLEPVARDQASGGWREFAVELLPE